MTASSIKVQLIFLSITTNLLSNKTSHLIQHRVTECATLRSTPRGFLRTLGHRISWSESRFPRELAQPRISRLRGNSVLFALTAREGWWVASCRIKVTNSVLRCHNHHGARLQYGKPTARLHRCWNDKYKRWQKILHISTNTHMTTT